MATTATAPGTGLHALTWLVWAIAAAASVQLAPSPVYVVVVLALSIVVVAVHGSGSNMARAFPAFVGIGVAFALLRVVLTAATTHHVGRVLFGLPQATLPRLLGGFTVGGSVELEVVLQAGAEGLAIVALVAAFGAFNAVASHSELVQAAPRAFYEPGLVLTVALAFVPSILASVAAVREADAARTGGRVVRRARLLRRLVPLLESGMERAVNLSESMDSRGFARAAAGPAEQGAAWAGVLALLGLAGAFVALVGRARDVAVACAAVGVVAIACAVHLTSGASRRTRYRPRPLTARDRTLVAVSLAAPVVLGVLAATGTDSLAWTATPLHVPVFSPLVALALAPLAVPVVVGAT